MTGAKPVFPSNCLAATSKPNLSATKLQHKHPKQLLQKTTNIRETKSNKSKCGLKHLWCCVIRKRTGCTPQVLAHLYWQYCRNIPENYTCSDQWSINFQLFLQISTCFRKHISTFVSRMIGLVHLAVLSLVSATLLPQRWLNKICSDFSNIKYNTFTKSYGFVKCAVRVCVRINHN